MSLKTKMETACFGGVQGVYSHDSAVTGTSMTFSVYKPRQADFGLVPVLYYLSGLTCTWENATTKAGAQSFAADAGLMLVFPDTSPRGEGVADDAGYDLGQGAGFYVNATQDPWSSHFKMADYVSDELPALIKTHFPASDGPAGITGHSMGGHGALTTAMRNPDDYASVSAFAPIVAPSQVPWGRKALSAYLGTDESSWGAYDATRLVAERGWRGDILIDQGRSDDFLAEQLRPELFFSAATAAGISTHVRVHCGYDHSYYFVSSFIGDHITWHAERLALG
jgi:S-formylglutathione hydrolase